MPDIFGNVEGKLRKKVWKEKNTEVRWTERRYGINEITNGWNRRGIREQGSAALFAINMKRQITLVDLPHATISRKDLYLEEIPVPL